MPPCRHSIPQSSGCSNARERDYLHLPRIESHKASNSSATSHSSTASSSESCSRPRRSDGEVYNNYRNYKSTSQYRRRTPSGSVSPVRHYSSRSSRDRQRSRNARDRPQASRCIGVFGLNTNTTQQKVRELFNKFGAIERIQMVIDAHTHRSRGFCFIYFEKLNDARVAKDACTGMEVDGRRIRVDYSITQRAHTPTPGVYMGRPSRRSRDRDNDGQRRRHRDSSLSHSPYDSNRRKYRSRHRSRSCSYSRSRSPRKSRVGSRY
ncbi:transformer-2 sex-determining protein isoform X3 [Drosophila busckii]|uniref:transformer-2 sex-determining protein isoform X3 n=1 Tax=Drosophila busckii TaxID=30019 RepID=UPI00083E9D8E|nr:transformer-2 sex-determining protein isoform X3 [Drosophila busckii]